MLPIGEREIQAGAGDHVVMRAPVRARMVVPGADDPGPHRRPAGELPPLPGVLRAAQGHPALIGGPRARTCCGGARRLHWSREGGARPAASCTSTCDPFFVSVERSLDPVPARPARDRGRPDATTGRGGRRQPRGARRGRPRRPAAGRRPPRSARTAPFRPGDLETYARASDDVTAILLAGQPPRRAPVGRRGLRRPHARGHRGAAPGARRRGASRTTCSAGSASTRRSASPRRGSPRASRRRWARPRGLLVVLPGYEASFLAPPAGLASSPDLPPHLEDALRGGGHRRRSGELAEADPQTLAALVGRAAAERLRRPPRRRGRGAHRGRRAAGLDPGGGRGPRPAHRPRRAAGGVVDGLAEPRLPRACGRSTLARGHGDGRGRRGRGLAAPRRRRFEPASRDEETARAVVARAWPSRCSSAAAGVRSLQVRLGRLARRGVAPGRSLFPRARRAARADAPIRATNRAAPTKTPARVGADAAPPRRSAPHRILDILEQAHPEADLRAPLPQPLRAGRSPPSSPPSARTSASTW